MHSRAMQGTIVEHINKTNKTEAIQQSVKELQADGFQLFLVSNSIVSDALNTTPYGIELQALDFMSSSPVEIDVRNNDDKSKKPFWTSIELLKMFNMANGLAFGPRGLPMPHWVMIDLALMPSALVVAAVNRDRIITEMTREGLSMSQVAILETLLATADERGYTGPIPVAGYCAAPSASKDRWVGWSLWSVLPGYNLGLTVKTLALEAYGARYVDGVTQFDNPSLRIHTMFGPMKLRSAELAIHTAPNSFVFESDLEGELPGDVEPSFYLTPGDTVLQSQMQHAIEDGSCKYYVLAPGVVSQNGESVVPIFQVDRVA